LTNVETVHCKFNVFMKYELSELLNFSFSAFVGKTGTISNNKAERD